MTTDDWPDRVRLGVAFDAETMRAEIASVGLEPFNYYDVVPLRAPSHLLDPNVPAPPPAADYADGSWTPWSDAAVLDALPTLRRAVDHFAAGTTVNLVRLLRLEPGATVAEHTDPTLGLHIERSMIRLTIPVTESPDVEFLLNGERVPWHAGECWYLRFTDPHSVVHRGDHERINLSIDVIPNSWIRDQLRHALA